MVIYCWRTGNYIGSSGISVSNSDAFDVSIMKASIRIASDFWLITRCSGSRSIVGHEFDKVDYDCKES